MKILVTGATGFVGGHVARRLHKAGHTVLATGRNQAKGQALGVPFQAAHLDDLEQALRLVQGQDAVIHCAALSSPWGSEDDFFRHNVKVTQNLLQGGCSRFIHMSSAGVYFSEDSHSMVTEEQELPKNQQHRYLASKRRAEEIVQKTKDWIILRPRAIYGPGDQAILPRIVRLMRYLSLIHI